VIRFIGSGKPPRAAPRGEAWGEGESIAVQVTSDTSMEEIPQASSLPPGTLVFVLPEPARPKGILSAFGRRALPRHARSGALLLRGYVDIGAEVDATSHLDLVFGRA
jgi:hypothetical protein